MTMGILSEVRKFFAPTGEEFMEGVRELDGTTLRAMLEGWQPRVARQVWIWDDYYPQLRFDLLQRFVARYHTPIESCLPGDNNRGLDCGWRIFDFLGDMAKGSQREGMRKPPLCGVMGYWRELGRPGHVVACAPLQGSGLKVYDPHPSRRQWEDAPEDITMARFLF